MNAHASSCFEAFLFKQLAEHYRSMRYLMKQKLFSWGDDFRIKNDAGEDVFFVDGRAFSLGNKLSFQDLAGNELAFIKQKLLAWGPTYEISRGGELIAVVKKQLFTLFRCRFVVDVPGPDDLEAQGNFLDMEYTFRRGDRPVAEVSKRWFSWADTYGVDIAGGEDPVLILASTVVIDMVCHADNKRA
ncbi:MAG TPA: LURP-one-related family protein [Verrucomicrobiae bacterium]